MMVTASHNPATDSGSNYSMRGIQPCETEDQISSWHELADGSRAAPQENGGPEEIEGLSLYKTQSAIEYLN